ncbi:hypothetical protein EDC01DRAFT_627583 [Geopyxis carbonaria]|nr:hypothetical protein EDC01DRAFT_627583 [Geopyxis carbonaria]
MASPPPPGSRPAGVGGGVRNLRAMFEQGGGSPAATPARGTPSREISPSPKPLGRVRTSFVAVGGKEGQMAFGLQKIPSDGDGSTQAASAALEGKKPDVPEPPKLNIMDQKTPVLTNGKVEETRKEPEKVAPAPKPEEPKPAPKVEAPPIKKETAPPKLETKASAKVTRKEPVPKEKEEPKPKKEVKPKPAPVKVEAPKATASTRPKSRAKLTVPASSSRATTPQPPKSPSGRTSRAGRELTHRKKPSVTKAPVPSIPTTKGRQPTLATSQPRTRQPIAHKIDPKPPAREPTKPVALRGTAFGPTASWVAKHGPEPSGRQPGRPPSAAGHSRRSSQSPPTRTVRRQNSTISDRSKEKAQSPHRRPATSAANRPTRTSEGSPVSHVNLPSNDFLSRMMRPTQSSACKIHEKKEPTRSFVRAGSTMSDRKSLSPARSKERKARRVVSGDRSEPDVPELPEMPAVPMVKLQRQASTQTPPVVEPAAAAVEAQKEAPVAVTETVVAAVKSQEPKIKVEAEEAETQLRDIPDITDPPAETELANQGLPEPTEAETTTRELSINTDSQASPEEGIDKDYEGHTPTTTASSSTLVHDGDPPEDVISDHILKENT